MQPNPWFNWERVGRSNLTEVHQVRRAELAIAGLIRATCDQMATVWVGHEREFLLELVRTLDHASFAFTLAPNRADLVKHDAARRYMLLGAATALGPLLKSLSGDRGGVPWGPSNKRLVDITDGYLLRCGELAHVRRLAELARYGLAQPTFITPNRLVIEVPTDEREREDRLAGIQSRADRAGDRGRSNLLAAEALRRIDKYIEVDHGWFVRYDPDLESLAYYAQMAANRRTDNAEALALPQGTVLGGRSFESWNQASTAALGRVLHHIACVTRLTSTEAGLDLRNLLTVFARKDDIKAVWEQSGEDSESADILISLMTLNADTAAFCESNHEIPLPFYVALVAILYCCHVLAHFLTPMQVSFGSQNKRIDRIGTEEWTDVKLFFGRIYARSSLSPDFQFPRTALPFGARRENSRPTSMLSSSIAKRALWALFS
jgi:hypothetical protein